MATHYIHKFSTTADFIARSPDRSLGAGLGSVSDVLYVNIAGIAYALADSGTGAFLKTKTDASATPAAAFNLVESDLTLSGTSISIVSTSHESGVRGSTTIAVGSTLVEGFIYGTQGRAIISGTMNEGSAARAAGVFGRLQIDGTWVDGQGQAMWADVAGAGTLTGHEEVNALRVSNSMAANINALIIATGHADFLLRADESSPSFFGTASDTTIAKKLKIQVNGTTYYIALTASL